METFLIKALQLILAFVLLVTIHEFGHYLFARIYGMRVEKFYLFFNPVFSLLKYRPDQNRVQLIAWTKKDKDGNEQEKALLNIKVGKPHDPMKNGKPTWRATMYGLGWLPLGGYCSIAGMIDETQSGEDLAKEPEPWEFRAKKPFPRLMVMCAGVIFNFLLAILIYIGIAWYWGDDYVKFEKAYEGMAFAPEMQEIGFRDGDILLAYNGEYADAANKSLMWDIADKGGTVTVLRDHKDTIDIAIPKSFVEKMMSADRKSPIFTYRLPAVVSRTVKGEPAEKAGLIAGDRIVRVANDTTPSLVEFHQALDRSRGKTVPMLVLRDGKETTLNCYITPVDNTGRIGIQLTEGKNIYDVTHVDYSLWESIPKGISDGTGMLVQYVSSLKYIFTKEGAKSIGGFGAIGDMFPEQWNWFKFWNLTAFLSVILAFMNILPIPALDGGHVIFTLWELITRRKPSLKVLEYSQIVGMAFLFLLLIYANANDIYRFLFK